MSVRENFKQLKQHNTDVIDCCGNTVLAGFSDPHFHLDGFPFEFKFVFPNEGAVGIEVDFIARGQGLLWVTEYPKDVVYL